MQILISWLPFLALAGAWICFMLYFTMSPAAANRRLWFGQVLQHLELIEKHLDEISRKLGGD